MPQADTLLNRPAPKRFSNGVTTLADRSKFESIAAELLSPFGSGCQKMSAFHERSCWGWSDFNLDSERY
jgi:hypothetical protein